MRVVVSVAFLTACQPPAPRSEPPPGDPATAIFSYAHPYVAREEPPARYAAPLPHTVAALADTGSYPPEGFIAAALDGGDANMQVRLREAVRRAARSGPVSPALVAFYDRLFGSRPSSAACDFLHAQVRGAGSRPSRAVFWSALARCRGPKYAATFARADAPDRVVVRWHALADDADLEFTKRLGAAALAVARRGPLEAREAGEALAHVVGRRAMRAVRELQGRLRDPERRALVAVGLFRRPEKAARAMVRRACSHPRVRFDDACSRLGWGAFDLLGDVRAADTDDEWLIAAYGTSEVLGALEACVSDGEWDDERQRCLHRLAALDWTRAVDVAAAIEESLAESSPLVGPVGTLARFPEPGGIVAELRELGLVSGEERIALSLSVPDVLVTYGRALNVDARAGGSSAQYEALLLELPALARPDLDGVAFDVVAPAEPGPFRLRAWTGGRLLEVAAGENREWLDVPAVVGLLNCLLRARGSELRFLTVRGRFATVVGASATAIEEAVAAGILTPRQRRARAL